MVDHPHNTFTVENLYLLLEQGMMIIIRKIVKNYPSDPFGINEFFLVTEMRIYMHSPSSIKFQYFEPSELNSNVENGTIKI